MAMVEQEKPDFGIRMRRLREERGVSPRQIADVTRISVGVLEALERNDISRLPGGIYGRSFVRSYAIEIGLDPEQTLRDFLVQFPHDSIMTGSAHAVEAGHASRHRRGGGSIAIVAFLAVIGVILFLTLVVLQ